MSVLRWSHPGVDMDEDGQSENGQRQTVASETAGASAGNTKGRPSGLTLAVRGCELPPTFERLFVVGVCAVE